MILGDAMATALNSHRPRLLILAYACSPVRGSESGAGWNRVVEAAKHFDTWVICEEHEFGPDIRRYLELHGDIPGLNFVPVPMHRWEWSLGKVADIVWYAMLKRWHCRAYRVARRLHKKIGFDLVHQLTFCGYREPGYLWKLDAPFVWGPVGGTQNYPWQFLAHAGLYGGAFELVRNILNQCQLRLSPRVHRAAHKAAAIVAATSTAQHDFARFFGVSPEVISDAGISPMTNGARHMRTDQEPLHILWSGVMQIRKALPLLIEALAQVPDDVPYCLRVLGEGKYLNVWRRLARRRGIDHRIQWLGWLAHEQAMQQYAWADVFVFTSLRDTTGAVMVEALGAGLPVICLDHQGARDVVTEDCGIKIPVTGPRETIAGLREAIVRLARDPAQRERLSRGAVERAKEFLWSRHGEKMAAVYRQVLEVYSEKKQNQILDKVESPALKEPHCRGSNGIIKPFWLRAASQRLAETAAVPLHLLFDNRYPGAFGILMYHHIAPHTPGFPPPTWNVTPERFHDQMSGLLAKGFTPWPLRKAIEYHHQGLPIPRNTFVLTFDDGYECFYSNAWPILKELQIPATVFVITGLLDADTPMPSGDWPAAGSRCVPASSWRPLTKKQCQELLSDGLVDLARILICTKISAAGLRRSAAT